MERIRSEIQFLDKRVMASEVKSEFYVTLLSNASMGYFPNNTQSSFRTKLSAPLVLNEEYEVALVETFIPRNWFNVGNHNNTYTLAHNTVERVLVKFVEKEIEFDTVVGESTSDFCERVNETILLQANYENGVRFVPTNQSVEIQLERGFEIQFSAAAATKLLYMLNLPNEDVSIVDTGTFMFRATTAASVKQIFKIVNRNPKAMHTHLIPLSSIKGTANPKTNVMLFEEINYNIRELQLHEFIEIFYDKVRGEIIMKINEPAEIVLKKEKSPIFMQKLGIVDDTAFTGSRSFKVDPNLQWIPVEETMELHINEYYERNEERRRVQSLSLDVGQYTSADMLFRSFVTVQFALLPNKKIRLYVPAQYEIEFSKDLANMLGLVETFFPSGWYEGKYGLELDGGITEIMIYSDLIASHHVGDTFAPLLRTIPCMSENGEQIVKHFHNPLYFSLRKNFIDTIEIELKTSSGKNIIFSGGKTHFVLSFRRKV